MQLFYMPGACSLASHIVIREADLDIAVSRVTGPAGNRRTEDGRDFYAINPAGSVPAIELDNGELLTEGQVILQLLAAAKPEMGFGPPEAGMARWRFLELLNFIATDVHGSFAPLYIAEPPPAYAAHVIARINRMYASLERRLGDNAFLQGGQFSILDAYAFTTMTWASHHDIALPASLKAYFDRIRMRPGTASALAHEGLDVVAV